MLKGFVGNFDAPAATDGLVIDLRANGGGKGVYGDEILSYLTDKPFQIARRPARAAVEKGRLPTSFDPSEIQRGTCA